MIAPCGLDCSVCDIHLVPGNPQLAEELAEWFKAHVDSQAEPSWFHCAGCPGDREDHWSPDCWILACCVDEKGVRYCNECKDFPCDRLEEWPRESKKYEEAFNRLRERSMNSKRGGRGRGD